MPLIGMPILSASVSISLGGMIVADHLLDVGELIGGFLDPGADLGADVHQDRTGVDRRKEVAAEERHQQERNPDETEEADHEQRPPRHRHRQQIAIAATNPLETRLEAALEPDQRIARRRRRLALT